MAENQNIEWKASWHDEYLKWICGFANAQGGRIYIGINDKGFVSGISDSRKMLEDIPNKIRDILGIIADVNLLTQDGKEYIEICVSPSSYPVNYKGEYHYRSGKRDVRHVVEYSVGNVVPGESDRADPFADDELGCCDLYHDPASVDPTDIALRLGHQV